MQSSNVLAQAAASLSSAARVVVLTGAGMSAESGVPTFRGAGGLWRQFRPEALATPEAFRRDPHTVWAWYRWRQQLIAAVAPHAGHDALARMEASRPGWQILTQNVDGLHQRAGSRSVIEVHGSIWRARCTVGCDRGAMRSIEAAPEDAELPRCDCGALLRPGVVWFGEALDPAVVQRAWAVVEAADVLLVVGTSAIVYPVAALPEVARRTGACVIEINPEETPLSPRADLVIRQSAAEALVALEQRM
jgi:NAD-dependent protein deacetylase/lipoamidase